MRKIVLILLFSITISCIIYSCQNASEIEFTAYLNNGKDIYKVSCQNCHGEKGEGLGLLAPPLTDTVFLKENKSKLACFIKNGTKIPMVIHGKKYEDKMPAFEQMADIDIAQVMVYITNSFGNKQGMYSYAQVASDLERCK